jgi:type II secretory pathway predicted ATPase ExeA
MTNSAGPPQEQSAPLGVGDPLTPARRPTHFIGHKIWNEARETVLALVTAGSALIVVLGPPGIGKTALLRDLAATFGERGRVACLLDFGDSPRDIGSAEIVLVDEAERMSAARLDELCSRGDLAIVLAALPASRKRFEHYPEATVVQLKPLSPNEARAFLVERLAQLGLPNACLTEGAWTRLIVHGRGVPRLLLILLGLALFVAGEEHAEQVADAHVEQAVEARDGGTDGRTLEPVGAEPVLVQCGVLEVPAEEEGPFSKAELDWIAAPPHLWRNRAAATAVVAAYLVSTAALLIWGVHQQMRNFVVPAPDVSAITRVDLPPPMSVETGQVAAIALTPMKHAAPAAQEAAGQASKLERSASLAVAPSLPPDRSMARTGVSGTDQNAATIALATAQLSELDAKTAGRTRAVAMLGMEREKLPSQVNEPSYQQGETRRHLAEVRAEVAPAGKSMTASRYAIPTIAHQSLRPVPDPESRAMPPRTTTGASPSAEQQLLAARKALADDKSAEARGLLEAAQTSIVFAPTDTVSVRASGATSQITDALSMLNAGDRVSALVHLDRAITAMRPTF